jgi:hypothetical protein
VGEKCRRPWEKGQGGKPIKSPVKDGPKDYWLTNERFEDEADNEESDKQ